MKIVLWIHWIELYDNSLWILAVIAKNWINLWQLLYGKIFINSYLTKPGNSEEGLTAWISIIFRIIQLLFNSTSTHFHHRRHSCLQIHNLLLTTIKIGELSPESNRSFRSLDIPTSFPIRINEIDWILAFPYSFGYFHFISIISSAEWKMNVIYFFFFRNPAQSNIKKISFYWRKTVKQSVFELRSVLHYYLFCWVGDCRFLTHK